MRRFLHIIFIAVLTLTLVALISKHYPGIQDQNKLNLFILLMILFSTISRISIANVKWGTFFRRLTGWFVISLLILTGYSYQYEIKQFGNRLSATIIPGYGQGNGDGSVTFYAGENGHFMINGLINDVQRVQFLFDTGASMVSLTTNDARDIGINVESLNYNFPLSTANGIIFGARVNLARVQVGPIVLENVAAVVSAEGSSDVSLLGMSFLGRLKQFVIKGNSLTLAN